MFTHELYDALDEGRVRELVVHFYPTATALDTPLTDAGNLGLQEGRVGLEVGEGWWTLGIGHWALGIGYRALGIVV